MVIGRWTKSTKTVEKELGADVKRDPRLSDRDHSTQARQGPFFPRQARGAMTFLARTFIIVATLVLFHGTCVYL